MATTESKKVTMTDGTARDFTEKRPFQKEVSYDVKAKTITLDCFFDNGEIRSLTLNAKDSPEIFFQCGAHGLSQKVGDSLAGLKNEDGSPIEAADRVMCIEDVMNQLANGIWSEGRQGGGGGASMLFKAVSEVTGKSIAELREEYQKHVNEKGEEAAKKLWKAIEGDQRVQVVIARLRAEKAAAANQDQAQEANAFLAGLPA